MRDSILFVVAVFVNLSLPITRCAVAEENKLTGEDALHLLDSLVAEQRKTLAKLETYEVKFTQTSDGGLSLDPQKQFHKTHIKRSQDRVWAERQSDVTVFDHPEDSYSVAYKLVANSEYVASFAKGHNPHGPILSGRVWEHDNFAAMSRQGNNMLNTVTNSYDFTKSGYGDGHKTLADISELARNANWHVEVSWNSSAKTPPLYQVRAFIAESDSRPRQEWTIDAARSCIVTRSVLYSPNDSPRRQFVAEPKEVEPNVWFPVLWTQSYYGDSPTPKLVVRLEVHFLAMGVQPETAECQLANLHMPKECMVMRTDTRGRVSQMAFVDNELVPRRLLQDGSR